MFWPGLVIQGALIAVAKFIVMPVNELDKVVIESNANPSIKGERAGVTVKVKGDNLVLSIAQNACFTISMLSYLAAFSRRQVRSTTDMLGVGTWKAMPVDFLFNSGIALPTALVAPIEVGMMFWAAPWPSCHRFAEESSIVFWVAAMAWTVVMSLFMMLKLSWMTLAIAAKQFVVQEAFLAILRELSYLSWFTPITNTRASAEGAEMMAPLASPFRQA